MYDDIFITEDQNSVMDTIKIIYKKEMVCYVGQRKFRFSLTLIVYVVLHKQKFLK